MVGAAILAVGILPLYQMVAANSRLHDRQKSLLYAHFVAKRILEGIATQASSGFEKVFTHDDFRSVIQSDKHPLSPWFRDFGVEKSPITAARYPVLDRELDEMLVRVDLLEIPGLEAEPIRHARVEVQWIPYGASERQSLVMDLAVSEYEAL